MDEKPVGREHFKNTHVVCVVRGNDLIFICVEKSRIKLFLHWPFHDLTPQLVTHLCKVYKKRINALKDVEWELLHKGE
eukprot:2093672-Ditylum_brightwellii.AAC.2